MYFPSFQRYPSRGHAHGDEAKGLWLRPMQCINNKTSPGHAAPFSDPTAKERSNTRLSYPIRAPPAKTHQSLDLFLTKVGQTSNSGLSTGHSFVLSELCAMSSGEDPLFTIDDTPLLSPLAPYPVYTSCGGESG